MGEVQQMQEKKDVLNRNEFIEKLLDLIKVITETKKGCSFAIDGKWGSGKSFVLEKLQKKLEMEQSEETEFDKYFVVYYDCWKYDFYDEPIISIITSIMNVIEDKEKIFCKETKEKFINTLETIASEVVKNKYGINIQKMIESAKGTSEPAQSYDKYYDFLKALKSVRKEIEMITENRSMVIIVDELDRCLPTYAIQVLERLHHIFEDLDNIILIIAMDKSQMAESLKTIYGTSLNVDMYMRKFISFTLQLDNGSASGFLEKYEEYVNLFEITDEDKDIVEEFLTDVTYEIDIRTQEKIFEKVETMHRIIQEEKAMDASVLLFEVLVLCSKEKRKSYNANWILDEAHNQDIERIVGKKYYNKMRKYKDDYMTGETKHTYGFGSDSNTSIIVPDTVISKCFIMVESLQKTYKNRYCGRYYIEVNMEKEIKFANKIYKLLST